MICVNGVEKKNCYDVNEVHSVHWGINPPPHPPSKTLTPLSCQAPPQICKLSKPPFLGNPSLYIGFS